MTTVNNGGPAFPLLGDGPNAPCFNEGMTLRDWFAGQALAGIRANPEAGGDHKIYAEDAVKFADALIAELAKEPTQ